LYASALKERAKDGCFRLTDRRIEGSKCGHLTDLAKQFRTARAKAGLAKDLGSVLQPARGY